MSFIIMYALNLLLLATLLTPYDATSSSALSNTVVVPTGGADDTTTGSSHDGNPSARRLLSPFEIKTVAYDGNVRHITGKISTDDALMMAHDLRRILHDVHDEQTEQEQEEQETMREYSRHERDFQRSLSTSPDPVQVTPVFQGIGTHYADIWVGEPKVAGEVRVTEHNTTHLLDYVLIMY